MNYGLIGIYGLYLVFVGFKGNSKTLLSDVGSDLKGFAPWVLAIVILKALSEVDKLRPVIAPFIGLAILTFGLKNYDTLIDQLNLITGLNLPKKSS